LRLRSIALPIALFTALSSAAPAARPAELQEVEVRIGDNYFEPQEIRVDVGDTVSWKGGGIRPHTVTSDDGLFNSGRLRAGDGFAYTFDEKGTFYYHCTLHGNPRRGMWGAVVVGEVKSDKRPKLVVPDDYPTIQSAVDHAVRGTVIVVRPGIYRESVTVTVPRVTIRGVDRFRTLMQGNDALGTAFTVTANNVAVRNLTIRNYLDNGVLFDHVSGYTIVRVDSIKNRTYGVRATASYDGLIRKMFGYGSGTAAVAIDFCYGCGALVESVRLRMNFTGLLAAGATGLTVRASTFALNGSGVLLTSVPDGSGTHARGALVIDNTFSSNNVSTIPASGLSSTFGLPFGTGVWIAGAGNSLVADNRIEDHSLYGVLVSDDLIGAQMPINNRVVGNEISGSKAFAIAWDGSGTSNCFDDNLLAGATGPPGLQDEYACSNRPFSGVPFPPVADLVDAAITAGPNRFVEEPAEPVRPLCQPGKPGCND
jgi:plastocyanin